MRRAKITGRLGPVTQSPVPARVLDAAQHGGPELPPYCPNCHGEWIEIRDGVARCLCGLLWYRTVGEIELAHQTTEGYSGRPLWLVPRSKEAAHAR